MYFLTHAPIFPTPAPDLLPGKASPYFGISDVKVSPALPQHLFLQGRGRYHFVSRDGGRSFSAIPTPGNSTGYEQVRYEWGLFH